MELDLSNPPELPVGQRNILEILRAASRHPTVLILDEPTASLSVSEIEILYDLPESLREQGWSVLFISHHLDGIFDVTDRVAVLRNGRLVATQTTSETTKPRIIEEMIPKTISEQFPSISNDVGPPLPQVESLYTPQRAQKRGVYLVPEERHNKGLFLNLPIAQNLAITVWKCWPGSV